MVLNFEVSMRFAETRYPIPIEDVGDSMLNVYYSNQTIHASF
jgi:hypothetical protein